MILLTIAGVHEALDGYCTSHIQVIERKMANSIGKQVDSLVAADKTDAVLTANDCLVMLRVEMAVRLITGSSGYGPNNVIQSLDQIDFSESMEDTPLMTAYSHKNLNISNNRNSVTWNSDFIEDGNFPAVKSNCGRQTYHTVIL